MVNYYFIFPENARSRRCEWYLETWERGRYPCNLPYSHTHSLSLSHTRTHTSSLYLSLTRTLSLTHILLMIESYRLCFNKVNVNCTSLTEILSYYLFTLFLSPSLCLFAHNSLYNLQMICAGYCCYGSATEMVITYFGHGVQRFTLGSSLFSIY